MSSWSESLVDVDRPGAAPPRDDHPRRRWTDSLPEVGAVVGGFDPAKVEDAVRAGYDAGFHAGHADGYAAAHRAAQEELAAAHDADRRRVGSMLLALRDELHRLTGAEADLRSAFEAAVVDTALALAEAVVGRELAIATDPGRDALARALAVGPTGPGPVTVRLHPTDLARLGDLGDLALGRDLAVVADPAVAPGGCTAAFGATEVDAGVASALDRARAVLLEGGPPADGTAT